MSQMLKSGGAMAGATLLSRVLGLVREICYARFMGNGMVAGAFLLAFMVPNLFRRLLGEGALTSAFVPVFKDKEVKEGEAAMWEAANGVLSGLFCLVALIVGVVLAVVSAVLAWGAPAENTRLMLELLRWMFPYMGFVCLAGVMMGMLNARRHFFVPALAPVIMNVILIFSVVWLAPTLEGGLEGQVFALAFGVLAAGVAQFLYQWPWLRREGFRWRWQRPWGNATVARVARNLGPATVGAAGVQINLVLTMAMGFWAGDHLVASFGFAVRLMEFPQGLFGVSLAAFLLPTLSGLASNGKEEEFRATLAEGLWHMIYINLLMMCLLLVLAEPMVRLLFEHGELFTAESTRQVAFALQCLSPALVFYSMGGILTRAFHAREDMVTPMKVTLFCVVLNGGLVALFLFTDWFSLEKKQGAFGIANAVTACVSVLLLGGAFERRWGRIDLGGEQGRRTAGAAILGVLLAFGAAWGLASGAVQWWGTEGLWARLAGVFVPVAGAGLVYAAVGAWLGAGTMRDLAAILRERGDGDDDGN
tara:strand:- start:1227 stop:2825 length:1599 start_codon:yes stop_codon:yes gene_type:complete